jgi:hypothetical protein
MEPTCTESGGSTATASLYIAIMTALLWFVRLKVNLSNSHGMDACTIFTTNALYDMLLVALWTTSASLQRSGEFSDNDHLSVTPWYLERACGEAPQAADTACHMAKTSYRLSVCAA